MKHHESWWYDLRGNRQKRSYASSGLHTRPWGTPLLTAKMFCCRFWLSGCPRWQEPESTSSSFSLHPPDAERRDCWAETDGQDPATAGLMLKKICQVQVKHFGYGLCSRSVLSVCKQQDVRVAASGTQRSNSNRLIVVDAGQVCLRLPAYFKTVDSLK